MMRPIFRTISFWACVVMAWINMVILLIAKAAHNQPLQNQALLTMIVCVVGAGIHWYLSPKKEPVRAQSKRRR